MKVQPRAVDGFVRQPPADIRAVLLFGPDTGKIREFARSLGGSVVDSLDDPFNVATLDGDVLESDPARLSDEASAQSLMGGRRLVWVRGAKDGHAGTVLDALERDTGDTLILLEAGELRPAGGLRKLFEGKRTDIAAIGCYADSSRDVTGVIRETLGATGVTVSGEAELFLRDHLGGDRMATRMELEKLALLAGPGQTVGLDIAVEAVGDSAALDLDALCSAAADGNPAAILPALDRALRQGESPIRVLRVAQGYFQRLDLVVARMAASRSAADAVKSLRPPPFFRTAEALARQASCWNTAALAAALARLGAAEIRCKSTGYPDASECGTALIDVARLALQAARRR